MGKITEIHRENLHQSKLNLIQSIKNFIVGENEITFKRKFRKIFDTETILCVGLMDGQAVLDDDTTIPLEKLTNDELLYICEELENKRYK